MPLEQLPGLLSDVARGTLSPAEAERRIVDIVRRRPFEDLGFARVDLHRPLRQGIPEVVYGAGKTPEQVAAIAERLVAAGQTLLVTRTDSTAFTAVREVVPDAAFHETARCITRGAAAPTGRGTILVATGGTSDLPVAEEARVAAETLGNRVETLYDVGVAGLHRVLAAEERLQAARVIVAAAGLEGALPSVIGGLVQVPVIAVPTSVGYGAAFGGLAALLGMLNSCASGVAVVNIDNGFGAAVLASIINHLDQPAKP
ncbi:MAG: nickel pincer cofactor biosynthesis protein LarB [Acidobacteria bacterium]|nr:nickel pincer cofactor biosynthesis protein LarB [Acidobacteriota bacterium]